MHNINIITYIPYQMWIVLILTSRNQFHPRAECYLIRQRYYKPMPKYPRARYYSMRNISNLFWQTQHYSLESIIHSSRSQCHYRPYQKWISPSSLLSGKKYHSKNKRELGEEEWICRYNYNELQWMLTDEIKKYLRKPEFLAGVWGNKILRRLIIT